MKIDFDQEWDVYLSETENVDVEGAGSERFRRIMLFYYDSLNLLKNELDQICLRWLPVCERAAKGLASSQVLARAREQISEYRREELGLIGIGMDTSSPEDAATKLLMFLLNDSEDRALMAGANVPQYIDAYAALYIEYFGRGKELAALLKARFRDASNDSE